MPSGNTSQIPSVFMGPTVSLVTHGLGRRRAVSLLPQRRREGAVGVYGFFFTWLILTKGLLLAYFCTCGTGRESFEDKKHSSDCTFLHLNVQESMVHELHSYSLVRDLLESYFGFH